jgi:dolichol-phosphate mannosyltransferase
MTAETSRGTTRRIYIVLPAYNEEGGLQEVVFAIKAAMEEATLPYSVVIVNDGSKDRTLEIAQKQSRLLPVQVIDHGNNRGLGEALKSGLEEAQRISRPNDIIVTMDADNTHPPDLIPLMVAKIDQGYDLVIASRFVKGAKEFGLCAHRKLLSRGASILFRFLFPIENVKDYTCGYRAYKATILQKAFAEFGTDIIREVGFNSIVEILLKIRGQRLHACELPLSLHYDQKQGPSKMPILKTIIRYFALVTHHLPRPTGRQP